ncbi:hypothetical protein QTP88_030105 [Uroleucon formosanum]
MAPFKGDLDRHVRPGNEAGPYATTPIRAATQKCAAGFGDGLFPVRSPLLGESRFTYGNLVTTFTSSKRPSSVIFPVARRPSPRGGRITRVQSEDLTAVVQSVVATGGVYKGQGRNQRELMTRAYWEFLVHVEKLQATIPKHEGGSAGYPEACRPRDKNTR